MHKVVEVRALLSLICIIMYWTSQRLCDIRVYIYNLCVCVRERERERDRQRQTDRQTDRQGQREGGGRREKERSLINLNNEVLL